MTKTRSISPSTVWQVPDQFTEVYSHATAVTLGEKALFISGQFGVQPDGEIPATFAAQATQAMANVEKLLDASGMGLEDLVKVNFYLTNADHGAELVAIRGQRWASEAPPAVTVVTVTALARPDYMVEIEAIAAV